ncbi:hypothetical protein EDB19DRAFT_1179882 [Suillus lakei]|nr:hypothetical protein EDB19DRAFT_1179882 [Suillus lakei]
MSSSLAYSLVLPRFTSRCTRTVCRSYTVPLAGSSASAFDTLESSRTLILLNRTPGSTTPSSTTQSCPPSLQRLLQFLPLSGCFQRPAPVHRTSLHPPHEQVQPPTLLNQQHPHCWRTELVQRPEEACLCAAAPNSCSCDIYIPFSYVHQPRCASSHCLVPNLDTVLLLLPTAPPSQILSRAVQFQMTFSS